MINKILKVELFTLFLFTLIAFFAFYYQSVLPDNIFSISSNTNEINFLSYYFVSFIATIGFYTGPWIFLPFLIFTIYYAFILSKREYVADGFLVISVIISLMSFTFLFIPNFLGRGLHHVLNDSFSLIWMSFAFILSTVTFLFGCYRKSFKDLFSNSYSYLLSVPDLVHQRAERKRRAIDFSEKRTRIVNLITKVRLCIPKYLKGIGKENLDTLEHSNPMITEYKKSHNIREEKVAFDQDNFFSKTNEDSQIGKEDYPVSGQDKELKEKYDGVTKVEGYLKNKSDSNADEKYREILSRVKLQSNHKNIIHPDQNYFKRIIDLLEEKLEEFKIDGQIINILKGPVVDTFELELGPGVKVSKVNNAADDLSLALYGAQIRIVYPIKGRTTVGIEVPRNPREIIFLDELIESKEYKNSTFALPVAMGKDAFGDAFIVDLAKMPHMLVAGATGAGKSVFINAVLVSLLLKKSPKQMQLILIDPKQLELALYSKLPHLAMPIITDAKTASIALLWAAQEMDKRYSILREFGVRNIEGFNEKLKTATPHMLAKIHQYYEHSPTNEYELPYLVIVIDEFADLILTKAGKEIECNVSRLAAKGRASGIHIILATQRPSVDVITGVIKSNFPTRVSFRVSSLIDSRTILDKMGAERLLGKGDMLYKHGIDTMRVHSSYVDESEIEYISAQLEEMETNFSEHVIDFLENGGDVEVDAYSYGSHITPSDPGPTDALFKEAMRVCAEQGSASASMLQRRLKIGYNRAANLIDELEDKGVVGPARGSKSREVLLSPDVI